MSTIIEQARRVLDIEAKAILNLKDRVGDQFEQAIHLLLSCKGKVVVTGMGKSGQICRKIAATFASTGTPAFFLHPAEGIHGDLGMVAKGDVVIAISNSGETSELLQILPIVKRLDVPIIALTGKKESKLAKTSDILLDISIEEEACPMGLAPTASTTATLAMGDALAVALLNKRGFKETDFAVLHPAGQLGRKLLYKVKDLMKVGDDIPLILEGQSMNECLLEISGKRMGVTGVTDKSGKLIGVVTDGDIRRGLKETPSLLEHKAVDVMTKAPKTIQEGALAAKAIYHMEKHKITSLFIVDKSRHPIGIIHLHDLLQVKVI